MRNVRRFMLVAGALVAFVMMAAPAGAAPSGQDVAWMAAAHQSNLAEIAAGNAAQQRATTDTVKNLGQMFVQMHTALDANLVSAAGQLGDQLPSAPTPAQQQQLAAVEANTGSAFDTAWIAQQLAGHRQALAAGNVELTSGRTPRCSAWPKRRPP